MTMPFLDRLHRLLQKEEWVKGAVNYDEDLHFSTFYLRASHARHTVPLYPGYSSIVAFYEGFNESYYLLKSECLRTATTIVKRAVETPSWLPGIVRAIKRRSDALEDVFDPRVSPASLAKLSDAGLLALYKRHAFYQRNLYKYARLPEALDRGVAYFTTYLREYLRKLGLGASECEATFAILSQPVVPSVLAQEMLEFEQIVREAHLTESATAFASAAGSGQGRAQMFLRPELLHRLRAHREKWKYLPYHGYGRRELATLGQYVERLVEHMQTPGVNGRSHNPLPRSSRTEEERQKLMNDLGIDPTHQALFTIYPEIGAAKLYRRFAQLRNFYFLDMLLAEIAERIGVCEWNLRCMLPEEIVSCLKAGRLVDAAVLERTPECMYALLPKQECVISGSAARELRQMFQEQTRSRQNGRILKGTVACRGMAVGPCKIIIRADDCREAVAPGSIVVSESTDPDLVGFIKNAAAVLTEQGGVTSHAAIICRELGIPTIIGIDGLLGRVHDGDIVEIDAEQGIVTLVDERKAPPPGTIYSPKDVQSPDVIGAKAYNLGLVHSLGFRVPEYVVVRYDGVEQLLDRPAQGSRKQLVQWALEQLNLPAESELALRSSTVNEDRETGSHAGQYRSLLHIGRDQLAGAFDDFVRQNRAARNGSGYHGSIIVQRMIEADCAGVCLTRDQRTGNGDMVIIELMTGGNEAITQGSALPDRVVVDRLTGDILESHRPNEDLPAPVIDVAELVRQFLTLEAEFGKPLDIEWALADGKLYILQARPIVQRHV